MSNYIKATTDAGNNAFKTSGKTGQSVVIDAMLISPTSLDANQATSLTVSSFSEAQTFPVVAIGYQNNLYQPQAVVNNNQLTNDLVANSVGLVGHLDGTNQQVLLAVMLSAGNPTTIPANGNYKRYIGFDIIARSASSVTCNAANTINNDNSNNNNNSSSGNTNASNIDLSNYVNRQQLNNALSSYVSNLSLSNSLANIVYTNNHGFDITGGSFGISL